MTTASMPDRLRQIAILISSVDSAAARQILLQLPTETARQIRQLTSRLGEVSAEERRRILSEFQRSATASSPPTARASGKSLAGASADISVDGLGQHGQARSANPHGGSAEYSVGYSAGQPTTGTLDAEQSSDEDSGPRAAWTRLSTAALVRFVREERAAVTAVVISQLAPTAAVEVLQHLPAQTRREVLLRLSGLQEIDPEAMQTIDEHLSQRLHEYQHQIQSELQNSRRIESLLAAAPPDVRSDWAALLGDSSLPSTSDVAEGRGAAGQSQSAQAAPADRAASAGRTQPATREAEHDILPFRRAAEESSSSEDTAADRLLIQWEFEQILELPASALAHLLSSTDSQTVLLALAGASPDFMKRFYRMLNRHDAKVLEARLQRIGPIQLRDVDVAQRKIVDNATRLQIALDARSSARQAA